MSKRYTAEQLSRILGEHSAGNLVRGGCVGWNFWGVTLGCINQAAYNVPGGCDDDEDSALHKNFEAACWFDVNYEPAVSAEELLHSIEAL